MIERDTISDPDSVVTVMNQNGKLPVLLVCEHASNRIPEQYKGLGLNGEALSSHIAWDPGAYEVARRLSANMDAPLVASNISRLVYDCNRPPEAVDAIPERSEVYEIPGNKNLSEEARQARIDTIYRPFEQKIRQMLEAMPECIALITIHSFTPVYHGEKRRVELGILHDTDSRLADSILDLAPEHTNLITLRNEPYSATDGVTHTLKLHGVSNKLLNVMIEIRNDLISDSAGCKKIADMLGPLFEQALHNCRAHECIRGAS